MSVLKHLKVILFLVLAAIMSLGFGAITKNTAHVYVEILGYEVRTTIYFLLFLLALYTVLIAFASKVRLYIKILTIKLSSYFKLRVYKKAVSMLARKAGNSIEESLKDKNLSSSELLKIIKRG